MTRAEQRLAAGMKLAQAAREAEALSRLRRRLRARMGPVGARGRHGAWLDAQRLAQGLPGQLLKARRERVPWEQVARDAGRIERIARAQMAADDMPAVERRLRAAEGRLTRARKEQDGHE